jgi:hypothetical protein
MLEMVRKMVLLLEEKTKIMVDCVVNNGQEGIAGVAVLK